MAQQEANENDVCIIGCASVSRDDHHVNDGPSSARVHATTIPVCHQTCNTLQAVSRVDPGTGEVGVLGAARRTIAGRTCCCRVKRVLLPLLCVMLVSCSHDEKDAPRLVIEPETVAVSSGQTTQYTVEDETPVLWGLDTVPTSNAGLPAEFPLTVSPSGRYVVDQRGQPWRVQADAAWLMSSVATPEEVEQYLDTRKAQGFNSFYLMAMVHPKGYGAAPNAPNNWRGDPPFAVEGDFSTAGATPESERYWQWIDWIVAEAAARNMVVMLSYSYLGWSGGDMGWYQDILEQPSRQSVFEWGKWLGNRYGDDANIIWFGLGDFAPPPDSEGALRVADRRGDQGCWCDATVHGRSRTTRHPAGRGPRLRRRRWISTASMDSARRAWAPSMKRQIGRGSSRHRDRRSWRKARTNTRTTGVTSVRSRGTPVEDGSGRCWPVRSPATGSDPEMSGNGRTSRIHSTRRVPPTRATAFALFATLPWWELAPSGTEPGRAGIELITEGQDVGAARIHHRSPNHRRRVAACLRPRDETRGAVSFSIDMTAMAGPTRARWFDPASGDYFAASDGYEFAASGSQRFTTPGHAAMAPTTGCWSWTP